MKVEAEGKELILRSKTGSIAIIPKDKADQASLYISQGKHDKINELIGRLPREVNYAQEGTLIDIPPELYAKYESKSANAKLIETPSGIKAGINNTMGMFKEKVPDEWKTMPILSDIDDAVAIKDAFTHGDIKDKAIAIGGAALPIVSTTILKGILKTDAAKTFIGKSIKNSELPQKEAEDLAEKAISNMSEDELQEYIPLTKDEDLELGNRKRDMFDKSVYNKRKLEEFKPGEDVNMNSKMARFTDDISLIQEAIVTGVTKDKEESKTE